MDERMPADTAQKMIDAKKKAARKKSQGLSSKQEEQMKKHSEHHSSEHMDFMRNLMLEGATFDEAHNRAQKKVGK